jgi:hypothetical protein
MNSQRRKFVHSAALGVAAISTGVSSSFAGSRLKQEIHNPLVIQFDGGDLQEAIDSAPSFSTILCNRNVQLIVESPVLIKRPITIKNLNARLPDALGKSAILEVHSQHVTISDFYLQGNTDTVNQLQRAPLIRIHKSNFRLERGEFENSSKDGVEISPLANSESIDGGVIRDIVGRGCVRDVISMNGTHEEKSAYIRNILVENIRGYNSSMRGTIEVSDGSENITIRKIYAEKCVYAVDWQDHNRKPEINRNVLIDDVYALDCRFAVRNAVQDFGHSNLTITNVIAERCLEPIKLTNTSNIVLENIRVIDHLGDKNPIYAGNCHGLIIRNISIINSTSNKEGVLVENCDELLIDHIVFSGEVSSLSTGLAYLISNDNQYRNLRISNVCTRNANIKEGIILLHKNNATLDNCLISGNISTVKDLINGKNALINNNL